MMNSKCVVIDVDGLDNVQVGFKIIDYVNEKGVGYKKINYKF